MGTEPDLILTSAAIYTVNPSEPWVEALAVRDGRISAVGSTEDIMELRGPATRVLDLPGRMVLPGFQDAHVHPPIAGIDRMRCDLLEVEGREEILTAVKTYAETHPDEPWILGSGWGTGSFPGGVPTAADLDAVVPDRPVLLSSSDGHAAWANSRAMELASVTRATPDPPDGYLERDAAGNPIGTFQEGAADLVEDVAPSPTRDDVRRGLLVAQEYLHSLGITSWQDAIVGESSWGDTIGVYRDLGESGQLTARVVGALWWGREQGLEQLGDLREKRTSFAAGRFRPTSVKLMLDGIVENKTAGVLEPYLGPDGQPTAERGIDFIDPDLLMKLAPMLDEDGFQMHFHAIGERAVRNALNALTRVQEEGRRAHRHHISHIQIIHPDDIGRFAELDVTANMQPLWACHEPAMDDLNIPILGQERSGWLYPFASLLRSGARLAGGSDWNVSTPNVFLQSEVAVTRIGRDAPDADPLLPGEAITLDAALRAYTMGSAYVNHQDDVTGSIEVGKYADLAVVDRNLFASDDGPIGDARVLLTLVEGEEVFSSGEVA
ncbi:MAG: amidohydrolase [Actinomycetota bacterium]